MPTRRRIVRRKTEPDGADVAFGIVLLLLVIAAFLLLMSELAQQMGAELLRQYGICRPR